MAAQRPGPRLPTGGRGQTFLKAPPKLAKHCLQLAVKHGLAKARHLHSSPGGAVSAVHCWVGRPLEILGEPVQGSYICLPSLKCRQVPGPDSKMKWCISSINCRKHLWTVVSLAVFWAQRLRAWTRNMHSLARRRTLQLQAVFLDAQRWMSMTVK